MATRNPVAMALIPAAALLGAFGALAVGEMPKSSIHLALVLISGGVMALCLFLAKTFNLTWLREWALGFAIIIALSAAYVLHLA